MTSKVNEENVRKVIDWIKEDNGKHLVMGEFCSYLDDKDAVPDKYIECGTAFCIAGYANLLKLKEEGYEPLKFVYDGPMPSSRVFNTFFKQFNSERTAAEWLGLPDDGHDLSEKLFTMYGSYYTLDQFDQFYPKIRVNAAIEVLEYLIKTGEVDWDRAINKAKSLYLGAE